MNTTKMKLFYLMLAVDKYPDMMRIDFQSASKRDL